MQTISRLYKLAKLIAALSLLACVVIGSLTSAATVQVLSQASEPFPEEFTPEPRSDNVVFSIFPSCTYADTSTTVLITCIREIILYAFFVAIVIFCIRVGWIAIVAVFDPAKSKTFKEMQEATHDLIVGMVLVGMPVTIMALINPLSQNLTFDFLREFSLGTSASLTDVTPDTSGCISFDSCVNTCKNTTGGSSREPCVSKCKQKHTECQECHQYVNAKGTVQNLSEYQNCISPGADIGSGGSSGGGGSAGATADINRNDYYSTRPTDACLKEKYGTELSEIEANWYVDYDFSFLNGGTRPVKDQLATSTTMINKEAVAGFDCVKNGLDQYRVNDQYQYDFPGDPGPPDFGGAYTFIFSNTTGRGMSQFLFHPMGLAIDLNVSNNCGDRVAEVGAQYCTGPFRDMPQTVVEVFESCGFFWGGYFDSADPMHFEYHAISCPNDHRRGVSDSGNSTDSEESENGDEENSEEENADSE